jgi:hypothetical protein
VTDGSRRLPAAIPPWVLWDLLSRGEWGAVMERLYGWVAIPLLLLGAVMLIAGVGATALWFAVIAVGMALATISQLPGAMARR